MGNMKVPDSDVERIGKLNVPKSECPVENGVVFTPWGAVAAGPLLAGISAGAQYQEILLSQFNEYIKNDIKISNIAGATLAGELKKLCLTSNDEVRGKRSKEKL